MRKKFLKEKLFNLLVRLFEEHGKEYFDIKQYQKDDIELIEYLVYLDFLDSVSYKVKQSTKDFLDPEKPIKMDKPKMVDSEKIQKFTRITPKGILVVLNNCTDLVVKGV